MAASDSIGARDGEPGVMGVVREGCLEEASDGAVKEEPGLPGDSSFQGKQSLPWP